MKKRNLILVFSCLLFAAAPMYAQVTIGIDEAPTEGALLQIKSDKSVTNGDLPNSTKGVAFPRVELTKKNELSPMFAGTTTAAQKSSHTGLVVFNTKEATATDDTSFKFEKGLYVWKGTEWAAVGSVPEVGNALRVHNDSIKWGGDLTEDTKVTADNRDIVFDLKNVENIRESGFMIKGLKEQANSIAVVVDVETGKLGLSEVIPARLAFIQSGTETPMTSAINSGAGLNVVPWNGADAADGGDVITNNNVLEFNPTDNSWKMTINAMVEISGMVGYIGATSGTPSIIVNATVQIKKNGTTTWEDYSSVRGVYAGAISRYRNTLNIPPAMADLVVGDEIRLIVARAPDGGGFLGDGHITGTAGTGIVKPYGTQFSKMLKVIVQ